MSCARQLHERTRWRILERAPDPPLRQFAQIVNEVIAPKGAWVAATHGWMHGIKARAPSEEPGAIRPWIVEETSGPFLSRAGPPLCPLAHGLDWCFRDGQPLTELGRMPSPGQRESFYLFAGHGSIEGSDGWRAFYKMKLLADDCSNETNLVGVIDG